MMRAKREADATIDAKDVTKATKVAKASVLVQVDDLTKNTMNRIKDEIATSIEQGMARGNSELVELLRRKNTTEEVQKQTASAGIDKEQFMKFEKRIKEQLEELEDFIEVSINEAKDELLEKIEEQNQLLKQLIKKIQ